ncbi:hypothetical protein CENSYa_0089 [Cenarchaeum symbiosum A]|uniref:Uncharacterized protein n=1 Tax=Cenarchaeum symbiosum (strain A) TaxID=414004 RepID=A0RTR7_CENSY|nr:hypothetical protein CENSYa_0089 [Cenarchaeum symbiosum A]
MSARQRPYPLRPGSSACIRACRALSVTPPGEPPMPPKTLLRSFIMSFMLVNPMTLGDPKGDWGCCMSPFISFAEDSETITYGEPSGEASMLLTTYSFCTVRAIHPGNLNFKRAHATALYAEIQPSGRPGGSAGACPRAARPGSCAMLKRDCPGPHLRQEIG